MGFGAAESLDQNTSFSRCSFWECRRTANASAAMSAHRRGNGFIDRCGPAAPPPNNCGSRSVGRWSAMRRPLAAPGTANAVGVGPARSLSSLGSSATGTSRRSLTGPQPSLVPKQIRELSACRWIAHGENVLLLGPPGVGKTHLALDHQQPHGLGVEDRLWRCRGRHRDPGSAAAPQPREHDPRRELPAQGEAPHRGVVATKPRHIYQPLTSTHRGVNSECRRGSIPGVA